MQQFPLLTDIIKASRNEIQQSQPPTQGITRHYGFLLVTNNSTHNRERWQKQKRNTKENET